MPQNSRRKTQQFLMPTVKPAGATKSYDIYPSHKMPDNLIDTGLESLARQLASHKRVVVDGYQGVFFQDLRHGLQPFFDEQNIEVVWIDITTAFKPVSEIEKMVEPFLGGDDPLFGTRTTLCLADFFDPVVLDAISKTTAGTLTVVYGPGAALAVNDGFLIYIDLPKNELQFRARAGAVTNLGASAPMADKAMYKRFYFVDWIVLNRHKQELWPRIDLVADGQHPGSISRTKGSNLRAAMKQISTSVFRVRPWFEPGVWGGTWCLDHIAGLNKAVPNYAWSFELIVPENGLVFESSGNLLEVSFDCLMFQEAKAVQGEAFERFGIEFPIRFDFLDTFNGGNLSVQCHPQAAYTKKHFNENFTQEETYYILEAADDSVVYLGFTDDISPAPFREALENSFHRAEPLDIGQYVKILPATRHDLFLIPPGTIHAAGRNNLVLEISTTPYIFTFKLYDWVRPDLDGKPRPLNIDRGMANLCFDRKGKYVEKFLKSVPVVIDQGHDWTIYHLPTHENHFYDVHRISLGNRITLPTGNKFHVMSVVEGHSVIIEAKDGARRRFHYAETFVVPAATGSYTLINESHAPVLIVKAFVK